MRFGLLMQVTGAQAMRFDYQKIESSRNFANKIPQRRSFRLDAPRRLRAGAPELATPADRWIFSRLANLVAEVDEAFDRYEFSDIAQRALYGFFWNEFCDWYIEFSKSRLSDTANPADRLACQRNLVFVLDQALRLLHPIMPFITEEIYQEMPVKTGGDMLIGAEWPDAEALSVYRDEESEGAPSSWCARSWRHPLLSRPLRHFAETPLPVTVKAAAWDLELLEAQSSLVRSLANVEDLVVSVDAVKPAEASVSLGSGIGCTPSCQGMSTSQPRKLASRKTGKISKDAAKLEKEALESGLLVEGGSLRSWRRTKPSSRADRQA